MAKIAQKQQQQTNKNNKHKQKQKQQQQHKHKHKDILWEKCQVRPQLSCRGSENHGHLLKNVWRNQ